MKRIMKRKSISFVLVCVFLFQFSSPAFAHPASQEGILAKTYMGQGGYDDYYIGGENIGWSIDEGMHTNGTTLTYSFSSTDPYLNNTYRSCVITGANLWNGTVTIINKTDGSGTGIISTANTLNTNVNAAFVGGSVNSLGHLTSWAILINRSKDVTPTILAHEFGHAIGLNDLYESQNYNKLMCGVSTYSTATGPTSADIWGAKVITGVHTTHTWGYNLIAGALGNSHQKYCTACNGLNPYVQRCTYGTDNRCTVCGYGRQTVAP